MVVLRFILYIVIKLKPQFFFCTVFSLNLAFEVYIAYKIVVIDLVIDVFFTCLSNFR